MGQAKQRGTFEQRKAAAKPKPQNNSTKRISRKPSGIVEYLLATILGKHHV